MPRFDWKRVDWSLQNIEIAERLGCSPQAVHHARARLGKPQSPRWGRQRESAVVRVQKFTKSQLKSMTRKQLAEGLGVTSERAGSLARALNLPIRRVQHQSLYLFEHFNWDLPTIDLATIWADPRRKNARVHISANRPRPPRWDGRKMDPQFDPAYRAAIRRERGRARRVLAGG